jgi:hypothetical protein
MIRMGAKSIAIVRAVTAYFFFDCRAAEVPSDEWIRDVPCSVHNDAQDFRLESFQNFNVGGGSLTFHMSVIRQIFVVMQRLVDFNSMVTNSPFLCYATLCVQQVVCWLPWK